MRFRFSILAKSLIAILLIGVGVLGQYRFRVVERYWIPRFGVSSLDQPATISEIFSDNLEFEGKPSLAQFWEVWQFLEQDYLESDKIKPANMIDGAIKGMVASLGDPYTTYLPPKQNQRSGEDLAGSFFGVGIELGYIDGFVAVMTPLPNSPAEKAGVQAGDLILKVTDKTKNLDEDATNWTIEQAVEAIRGTKGSVVTLTLLRPDQGNKPFEVSITRDEIVVKSVEMELIERQGQTFAHIKLYRFGGRTNGEWDALVSEIVNNPAVAGIILDMRGNPGGFFDGAIDVASEFIESGVVVTQKGKYTSRDFPAQGKARLAKYPLVVLVNKGSASASEIVAGALRDRLGVKLVGKQTFGKGTVQDRRELSNGGGVHITVARWMLPGGDWIQDTGIPVDVEVEYNPDTEQDEQLLRALQELDQVNS